MQNQLDNTQYGDLIDQLPTDKTTSSHNEILIVKKMVPLKIIIVMI